MGRKGKKTKETQEEPEEYPPLESYYCKPTEKTPEETRLPAESPKNTPPQKKSLEFSKVTTRSQTQKKARVSVFASDDYPKLDEGAEQNKSKDVPAWDMAGLKESVPKLPHERYSVAPSARLAQFNPPATSSVPSRGVRVSETPRGGRENDYNRDRRNTYAPSESRRDTGAYEDRSQGRGRGRGDNFNRGGRGNFRGNQDNRQRFQSGPRESRSLAYDQSSSGQASYQLAEAGCVFTNYYTIKIDNSKKVHVYTIISQPSIKELPTRLQKELLSIAFNNISSYFKLPNGEKIVTDKAYEIYSPRKLENISQYAFTTEGSNGRRATTSYTFTITLTKELSPLDLATEDNKRILIQAFETIFKNCNKDFITFPRFTVNIKSSLNKIDWFELWKCVKQHIITSEKNVFYVNIEVGYAAIYPNLKLHEIILNMSKTQQSIDLRSNQRESVILLTDIFKGIQVKLNHINMKKKILKFSRKTANSHKFIWEKEDGVKKEITVEKYFLEKYKTTLKYPGYPMVKLQPATKKIYVPIELCSVEKWQTIGNRCDLVSKISKYAIMAPYDRRRMTDDALNQSYLDSNSTQVLESFGVSVEAGMCSVGKTELNSPCIQFSRPYEVSDGQFKSNSDFFSPSKNLKCVYISSNINYIDVFYNSFSSISRKRGMSVFNRQNSDNIVYDLKRGVEDVKKNVPRSCNIVFIIETYKFPNYIYQDIKRLFDIELGIPSQVVILKTPIDRGISPGTMHNLLLKINVKTGGENFHCLGNNLKLGAFSQSSSLMVMGADVNHAQSSSNSECAYSCASVVSSLDNNFCYFTTEFALNKRGQDIIEDMQEITIKCLQKYKDRNKNYPQKIVMFRDGLSEGQFMHSRIVEITAMKTAFDKLKIKPKFTFICVQKRHNTRFYSGSQDENVRPGTFIQDEKICQNNMFYLLAHKNLKGTAKSAQYKILIDESNSSRGEIASFAYLLSNNYCRSFTTVSIPAPTYYSHLGALRSNLYKNYVERCKEASQLKKKIDKMSKNDPDLKKNVDQYLSNLKNKISPHTNLNTRLFYV